MRRGDRAIGAVLCGMLLVTVAIWLVRQSKMERLDLRPGPQSGVEISVIDRGKVNINLATEEQLDQLPGIGPVLAKEIVRYRQVHGPFVYPEHLVEVPGISTTMMQALLDKICV